MKEYIDTLGVSQIFSNLGANSGYWPIKVRVAEKEEKVLSSALQSL